MKPFSFLVMIYLVLVPSATTFAEPYSVSCDLEIEKLYKARMALIPFQRAMERAKIHERVTLSEAELACRRGGIYNVQQDQRCHQVTAESPLRTKEALEAEDVYLQGRRAFEEQLNWVTKVCLLEP